jgi:NAD(P)H-nitrite reductase large subunit
VCYCNKVNEGGLREAIGCGATSVEALSLKTRAGTGCGSLPRPSLSASERWR